MKKHFFTIFNPKLASKSGNSSLLGNILVKYETNEECLNYVINSRDEKYMTPLMHGML